MRKAIRGLNRALMTVAAIGTLALSFIVLWGVFTRYVLGAPTFWVLPSVSYLLLFIVFFGMSGTLQNGMHVRIDLVTEAMSKKSGLILRQVGDLLGIGLVGLLTVGSAIQFIGSVKSGQTDISLLRLPFAFTQWVLVLGFGLMFITYVLQWIDNWPTGNVHLAEEEPGMENYVL